MNKRQDKRQILADILAGRLKPDAVPGKGDLTITPALGGLVDVNGQEMTRREAKRAIRKAATVLFFEGDDGGNELFNELADDVDYVIDFSEDHHNNDLNRDNG